MYHNMISMAIGIVIGLFCLMTYCIGSQIIRICN